MNLYYSIEIIDPDGKIISEPFWVDEHTTATLARAMTRADQILDVRPDLTLYGVFAGSV